MRLLNAIAQRVLQCVRQGSAPHHGTIRYLRVFSLPSNSWPWLDKNPPLLKLLQCFDVKRDNPRPEPVSVYRVASEIEEVETASALFLTAPKTPDKRFGVLVSAEDCKAAGINLDASLSGTTGIAAVDGRHADLKGKTVEEFGHLMAHIVQSMWEGEQRIRLYPAQQIVGQIALFSKLSGGDIEPVTKQNCLDVLAKIDWHMFEENLRTVVIRGSLDDRRRGAFPVFGRRRY